MYVRESIRELNAKFPFGPSNCVNLSSLSLIEALIERQKKSLAEPAKLIFEYVAFITILKVVFHVLGNEKFGDCWLS